MRNTHAPRMSGWIKGHEVWLTTYLNTMSESTSAALPPHFNVVNGLPVSRIVTKEQVDKIRSMVLRPDDVWIVSYPKAGTTWTQNIVHLILKERERETLATVRLEL